MSWGTLSALLLGAALSLAGGWVQQRWNDKRIRRRDRRLAEAAQLERLQDALAALAKAVTDFHAVVVWQKDYDALNVVPDPEPPEHHLNIRRALVDVGVLASRTPDERARAAATQAAHLASRVVAGTSTDSIFQRLDEAHEAIADANNACGAAIRTLWGAAVDDER